MSSRSTTPMAQGPMLGIALSSFLSCDLAKHRSSEQTASARQGDVGQSGYSLATCGMMRAGADLIVVTSLRIPELLARRRQIASPTASRDVGSATSNRFRIAVLALLALHLASMRRTSDAPLILLVCACANFRCVDAARL